MRIAAVLLVSTFIAVGCAGRQQLSTPNQGPSFTPGLYIVRIKAAMIEPRRPDGSPWHVTQPNNAAVVLGAVGGLAIGNPALGMAIGNALAGKGGDPQAPVPYVLVKIAGTTWTIMPTDRSYAPSWDQPIELNARALRGDEQVIIQVIDGIDDALIGQRELTLAELVSRPAQTLTNIRGSVATLDCEAALQYGSGLDDADLGQLGD